MNTDAADTRNPHLDIGNLIAEAAGQPVGDRAKEHLAGCEHCQLEASRWHLVADGVRSLAATESVAAEPAWPRRTRQRVPIPWRRGALMVGSAAAALVLLVGIGALTGLVHVHVSSGPSTEPVLTAVTGCAQLEQANGTLEQVNGSSVIIQTISGRSVTATTTASTFLSASGALLSDITDGASVMVRGSMSDGKIEAAFVTVGQPFTAVNPPGFVPVQGTVTDAGPAGFILVTSTGTRIPVTTSHGTLVVVPHAGLGQLQVGASVFAIGNAGPDGTLSARAVAAVSQLPPGIHASVRVKSCAPSSIIEALGAISTAPTSTG
jgi:hypothetical protein